MKSTKYLQKPWFFVCRLLLVLNTSLSDTKYIPDIQTLTNSIPLPGILQKGDGSNIYLKTKPKLLLTTMGNGARRPLDCDGTACNGTAATQLLLAPVALAAAPDGSLYVGDFNLVRRVTPEGMVSTVVQLR